MMKSNSHEVDAVIYRGVWSGIGKMYNVDVGYGYTTIIIKPGESIKQRVKEMRRNYGDKNYGDRICDS
jgi:hypothetical protein